MEKEKTKKREDFIAIVDWRCAAIMVPTIVTSVSWMDTLYMMKLQNEHRDQAQKIVEHVFKAKNK